MNIFNSMEEDNYEQMIFCQDKNSGLKAIIVIHDTTLGPALGGARMWPYETEEEAMEDALRLAKGMTYKNSAAGLNLGGGKTVIIGDPKQDKSPELFRALGRYIQSLNGRYITAEDVGTSVEDMDTIKLETDFVTGTSPETGSSGNPAPITAHGLYQGMKAAANEAFGTDSLEDKVVAVQGVGNVAYRLCGHLHKEGAKLVVTDINQESVQQAVENYGAIAVEPNEIYRVDCDIFSPCALGSVLNDDTIPQLKAKVIAGSANNQLAKPKHGDLIFEKEIVYAPDFVINSGGVNYVSGELERYNESRAMKKVDNIYDSLKTTFEILKRDQNQTYLAANQMAVERITSVQKSTNQFLVNSHHALSRRK